MTPPGGPDSVPPRPLPRPPSLQGLPLLDDLPDVDGRRVLVRAELNVPLEDGPDGSRRVSDDFRIQTVLPTLHWLAERGARITVCSHLGRPEGSPDPRWSMTPVCQRLAELCPGVDVMENLRFDPGETSNDPAFVDRLVDGFEAYVNEAFGASHRAHASIVGPPARLPSAAGLRLAREVEVLGGLFESPARPFLALLGGAKVADKLGVLQALASRVDTLAVGGAMAFTFLAAEGHGVGESLVDQRYLDACRQLLEGPVPVLVPTDVRGLEPGHAFGPAAGRGGDNGVTKVFGGGGVAPDLPDGWVGLDVGPETAEAFAAAIAGAATVLWNGPLGAFEDERFADGTHRVAQAVADCPGFTVIGGGDSASALEHLGLADRVDFLSTGGGASLELLEHGDLPGLAALRGAPNAPAISGAPSAG